jgi:hypothetical protein
MTDVTGPQPAAWPGSISPSSPIRALFGVMVNRGPGGCLRSWGAGGAQGGGGVSRPARSAMAAAWTRLETPSLRKMLVMCTLAVLVLM